MISAGRFKAKVEDGYPVWVEIFYNIAMRRLLWCYKNLLVLMPPSLDIWLENIDKELEGYD
jgi:hypothetical protein